MKGSAVVLIILVVIAVITIVVFGLTIALFVNMNNFKGKPADSGRTDSTETPATTSGGGSDTSAATTGTGKCDPWLPYGGFLVRVSFLGPTQSAATQTSQGSSTGMLFGTDRGAISLKVFFL